MVQRQSTKTLHEDTQRPCVRNAVDGKCLSIMHATAAPVNGGAFGSICSDENYAHNALCCSQRTIITHTVIMIPTSEDRPNNRTEQESNRT